MNIKNLCMGCMNAFDGSSDFCPHCGYKTGLENSSRGLQPKTILNGKYLVGKILGEGKFGITYIGYDLTLEYKVAIKEYFPSELATRDSIAKKQTHLTNPTVEKEEKFVSGLERFEKESQALTRFNELDGIVSVKEFFYENSTGYMVTEYIDGFTLSKYLSYHNNKLPSNQVISMMMPLMDSLEKLHAGNIIHRDICPDNIMVTESASLKLIDFGAGRILDFSDPNSLNAVLRHGYAPEEQYQPNGIQNARTDIYALSATMYYMISGTVPQKSTDRILRGDKVTPLNRIVSTVPNKLSDAIMHGLAIKANDRPESISAFKNELKKGKKKILPYIFIGIGAAAFLFVLVISGIIVAIRLSKRPQNNYNSGQTVAQSVVEANDNNTGKGSNTQDNNVQGGDVQDSNVQEAKVFTEGEIPAMWREYQDKILNTLGVSFVVPYGMNFDENGLYGCLDDFDADGDSELFLELDYGLYGSEEGGSELLFADKDGVWMKDNDGNFVSIDENSEQAKSFKYYFDKDRSKYDNYFLTASELNSVPLGNQKILNKACSSVWDQKPYCYTGDVITKDNILFCEAPEKQHYYTTMGEGVLCSRTTVYYSPYFTDGQYGELASCLLTPEQYTKSSDLVNQINKSAEYVKNNIKKVYFYEEGETTGTADSFKINDVSLDSVLYNEAGYYVFNYKCACTFDSLHHITIYNWERGTTYYVGIIEDLYGEVTYTGSPLDIYTDGIEGLYAYVIMKCDGDSYTMIDCNTGYIGSEVTDKVLATSKSPWGE